MNLSDSDVRAFALEMWANYIETGNRAMSARDVRGRGGALVPLETSQSAFVLRLRALAVAERGA
jgi:hypothetical protein